MEKDAREQFLERHSVHHKCHVSVEQCGLLLSVASPFLGASPDGLVNCVLCGPTVLEIKVCDISNI